MRAARDVNAGDALPEGGDGFGRCGCANGLGLGERGARRAQQRVLVAIGDESVVADAVEAARQDVKGEAAQELQRRKLHDPVSIAVGVVLVAKAHHSLFERHEPLVGEGAAVRVAPEVLEHGFGAGEGSLGVDDPSLLAQIGEEGALRAWLAERRGAARERELPVPYFDLVFTLPHELNALAQGNPRALYAMLFAAAAQTLVEFGENPRWLGGEIAGTLVLHTWGQTLTQHLHVHCLVAAGALSTQGAWIRARRGFLFPVKALSAVFRGKFLAALGSALERGQLALASGTATLV